MRLLILAIAACLGKNTFDDFRYRSRHCEKQDTFFLSYYCQLGESRWRFPNHHRELPMASKLTKKKEESGRFNQDAKYFMTLVSFRSV